MHRVARDFRAFMAVRSRYVEDQLARLVAQGVTQYVVLGAGLDTFAYRNPFPSLHVLEVDFPATQQWKQQMLAEAQIAPPANLTFVPVDFEHRPWLKSCPTPASTCKRPRSSAGSESCLTSPSRLFAPP